MKKYKTWEVIKMMAEDEEKVFRCLDLEEELVWKGDYLLFKNGNELILNDYAMDYKWELVQQPVTFEKVLKSSGRCRVEHELLNEYEITSLSDFMEFDFYMINLCDCASLSFDEIKKILKEGKWYLED